MHGQHFAKQHNPWPYRRAAARAQRRQAQLAVVGYGGCVIAAGAEQVVNVAVNLDQVAAAGIAVEAVDVLGQHADLEALLPFGDDGVGIVEACAAAGMFNLVQIFPGDGRIGFQHRPGQGGLDREPVLGGLIVVQPTDAAIGRQAGIGGNAGTGDKQQPARALQFSGDAGDEGGVGSVHGAASLRRLANGDPVKILMPADGYFPGVKGMPARWTLTKSRPPVFSAREGRVDCDAGFCATSSGVPVTPCGWWRCWPGSPCG